MSKTLDEFCEQLMDLSDTFRMGKENTQAAYCREASQIIRKMAQALNDSAFEYEPCISCNRMSHAQDCLAEVEKIIKEEE